MERPRLIYELVRPNMYPPCRSYDTDTGLDLRLPNTLYLPPKSTLWIDMLIKFNIPEGYFLMVANKSGRFTYDHILTNSGGLIDWSYRRSVVLAFHNFGDADVHFKAGDKIAQVALMPLIVPELIRGAVEELPNKRSGLGSTNDHDVVMEGSCSK